MFEDSSNQPSAPSADYRKTPKTLEGILGTNVYLTITWVLAVFYFVGALLFGNFARPVIPGITEAREYRINFSQPVVVKEVSVQSGQFVRKGDPLFLLSRPDLLIKKKENESLLMKTVIEMNLLWNRDDGLKEWDQRLTQRQEEGKKLSPLALRFLSLVEIKNYINSETQKLKVLAPVDGNIGEIIHNVGETVPPYTSLVTLYRVQPGYVVSYVPESFDYVRLNQSRQASIQSMSRELKVIGKVVTVGTILTELPQRFQKDPINKIFGRKIKIEIPQDNQFYLGEKVYVLMENLK